MRKRLSVFALLVVLALSAIGSVIDLAGYSKMLTDALDQLGPLGVGLLWLLSNPTGRLLLAFGAGAAGFAFGRSLREPQARIVLLGINVTEPTPLHTVRHLPHGQKMTYALVGPRFVEVSIANEATGDDAGSAWAKSIAGMLTFYRDDGRVEVGPLRYARWVGKPEPQDRYELATRSEMDLPPNGIPQSLNIALKYDDDPDAFAFTNRNTVEGKDNGWRSNEHRLPPARYWVRIELRGVGVSHNGHWVRLISTGHHNAIVATMSRPSWWFRMTHRK